MNTEQIARYLAVLERIADAVNRIEQERLNAIASGLERIADALEAQARPTHIIHTESPLSPAEVRRIRDELSTPTKGPHQ